MVPRDSESWANLSLARYAWTSAVGRTQRLEGIKFILNQMLDHYGSLMDHYHYNHGISWIIIDHRVSTCSWPKMPFGPPVDHAWPLRPAQKGGSPMPSQQAIDLMSDPLNEQVVSFPVSFPKFISCRFLNNSFNHNWAWEEVQETSWRGLTVWRCSLIGNHWKQEMNNWPQVNKSATVSVCSLGLSTWAYSIKHHETTIFMVKIMINIDDIDEHL